MKWIKCSERLPEYELSGGKRYLILLNGEYPLVASRKFFIWSACISCSGVYIGIDVSKECTHWMLLPPAPEVEEQHCDKCGKPCRDNDPHVQLCDECYNAQFKKPEDGK